jgi:two-component system response regulator AtoC
MHAIRRKIEKVASSRVPLLIQGEGGTGKEVLARLIHSLSSCAPGTFAKVDCATIPAELLESELFGYERGSFTGAQMSKPGRVEMAHQGTLLLDVIEELDLSLQAKVLQLLQDGQFTRIGGHEERHIETRVICTTNRDLGIETQAGRFRPDLFYRINVVTITLPRLTDRREDIGTLAEYFLTQLSARFERNTPPFPRQVLQDLCNRDWPGNIRELENFVARYVILGPEHAQEEEYVSFRGERPRLRAGVDPTVSLKESTRKAIQELEKKVILRALEENKWSRKRTAGALRISYRALIYKLGQMGLRSSHKPPSLPSR